MTSHAPPPRSPRPADKRRYRRLPAAQRATLEMRDGGGQRVSLPVTIVSLSPEGAAVALDGPDATMPLHGSMVTLRFKLDDRELELPGRVRWTQRDGRSKPRVGLQLLLELTVATMRQRYAQWIVAKLRR